MLKPSLIVELVTEKMVAFVVMFGFYIILHGASSPGGGFQGGVIVGAAYILFAVGINPQTVRQRTPAIALKIVESTGVLMYAGSGLLGIILGYTFLANKVAGVPPQGAMGGLFCGGTLLAINIGIGIHVASTIITLYLAFLEYVPPSNEKQENGIT